MDTPDQTTASEPQSAATPSQSETAFDSSEPLSVGKTSSWEGRSCPALLRITSGGIQGAAAFSGIAIGTAISLAIYTNAAPQSLLGRLFNLGSLLGTLPVVMVAMFAWGAILCCIRYLRARGVARVCSFDMAADLTLDLKSVPLDRLLAKLKHSAITNVSPLLRRVRMVLEQWFTQPSLQNTLSLLNQQAVADAEDIQHAYGVVKTFIWALPVLGLIGTVIGIAMAVGDFGSLVGGDVDDIALIKKSLVEVTAGLSFAFTTTLLGLLGALLLVMLSSALQVREEKLITKADKLVAELLLPELQHSYPEQAQHGAFDARQLQVALTEVLQNAMRAARTAANEVLREAEARSSKFQQWFASESEKSVLRICGTMEKHIQATAELSGTTSQLLSMSARLTDTHVLVTQSIQEMRHGPVKALESLAHTMHEVAQQNDATRMTLKATTEATQTAANCQQSLAASLQRMESLGLNATLDHLARTLGQVSEVLLRFQEPMVFQAVPVSSVTGKEMKMPARGAAPSSSRSVQAPAG